MIPPLCQERVVCVFSSTRARGPPARAQDVLVNIHCREEHRVCCLWFFKKKLFSLMIR